MTVKNIFLSMPPKDRSDFLSVKDAAYILGKHPSAIRRMIDEGKLKAVKVGGTWSVYRPSLEQQIQESS